MDLLSALPEWLVWCLAGGIGLWALAALAHVLQALLDLELS